MTKPRSRAWVLGLGGLLLVACAQGVGGGSGDDDDDDDVDARVIDASVIDGPASAIDAPPGAIDARPVDARVIDASPLVDAPIVPVDGPTGLFCASTAECAVGSCCFPPGGMGFCVPGSEPIPGFCIPS